MKGRRLLRASPITGRSPEACHYAGSDREVQRIEQWEAVRELAQHYTRVVIAELAHR